ncbi:hypothetical protein [Lentilactobacillus kisonensis]|uniref:Uncharacterized protein n=1 Tax=Lentilactobacillus kisonensis DSM 19906 = JCM 15041 TaxID=1423766 RepID=A0A0R1NZH4_9LACO|nr:hypothetical protein [Lentilactobacillus kisonensis]KRL22954.1 hypothetical protein FC98_GL001709 [Lentilactobacillus kisonensis DSM 19906 = JCM 15041]
MKITDVHFKQSKPRKTEYEQQLEYSSYKGLSPDEWYYFLYEYLDTGPERVVNTYNLTDTSSYPVNYYSVKLGNQLPKHKAVTLISNKPQFVVMRAYDANSKEDDYLLFDKHANVLYHDVMKAGDLVHYTHNYEWNIYETVLHKYLKGSN